MRGPAHATCCTGACCSNAVAHSNSTNTCAGLLACRRYAQERQAQHDEPAGGASTSGLQDKPRDRVKFAVVEASSGDGGWPGSGSQLLGDKHGGSTPVAVVSRTGFFSFTRPKVLTPGDQL